MKTKIAALITALLIILIGAGGIYYISQTSPQVQGVVDTADDANTDGNELPENQSVRYIEDSVDTRVEDWLKEIGQEFGLTTLNILDGSFIWISEIGEEEVLGQAIILDGTLDISEETIVDLFQKSGFEENTEQTNGFTKEDLACLIKLPVIEEANEEILDAELLETEIRCGLINIEKNIAKKLFLDLNPEMVTEDILIDIIQSTPDHLSGNVQFIEPDEDASAPTQDGVEAFLASKDKDSQWVLVYHGNEKILCSEIEPYDFPVDMLPECFSEETNEMVNRTQ